MLCRIGAWKSTDFVKIGKTSGLVASRKRRTEKANSLEASRTLRDDLEGLKHYACSVFRGLERLKHYACSVFCGLEGLKHYACNVFCGPGDATQPSNVARESYPGPPEPYNFYMITNNIYWVCD